MTIPVFSFERKYEEKNRLDIIFETDSIEKALCWFKDTVLPQSNAQITGQGRLTSSRTYLTYGFYVGSKRNFAVLCMYKDGSMSP